MSRSRWIWIGLVTGLFLLAFSGCKCGKKEEKAEKEEPAGPQYQSTVSKLPGVKKADVAALIPQDAAFVVIADDAAKFLSWLEGRKWFQEFKKTSFFDDLRFTAGWFRLSTVKHRVESVSAVRVGDVKLKELLKTPLGLSVRSAKDKIQVLLVKQIDLRIQALDRLAEVFNQITPRQGMMKSRDVEGLKLRELSVDEDHRLYYLLFSDMMLVSNSEEYLLQATDLARGQSSGSIADDSEIAALLLDGRADYDLVAYLDPLGFRAKKKKKGAGMLRSLDKLMLRFKTGDPPRLEITGVLDKQQAGKDLNVSFQAGKVIPMDSRMVLGMAQVDLVAAWKRAVPRMESRKPLPAEVKTGVSSRLLPALGNQVLILLGGVDVAGKRPVPHAGILLKIDKQKIPDVVEATGRLFTFLFGEKTKKRVLKQMSNHAVYELPGDKTFSPTFSIVEDWLAVCTTEEMLGKIVATSLGHEPAIGDLPGFSGTVAAKAKPFFFLTYLDCGLLFEDMQAYFRAATQLGDRFDQAAVEETVTPLLDALKKVGKFGGAMTQRGAGITGSVVPL